MTTKWTSIKPYLMGHLTLWERIVSSSEFMAALLEHPFGGVELIRSAVISCGISDHIINSYRDTSFSHSSIPRMIRDEDTARAYIDASHQYYAVARSQHNLLKILDCLSPAEDKNVLNDFLFTLSLKASGDAFHSPYYGELITYVLNKFLLLEDRRAFVAKRPDGYPLLHYVANLHPYDPELLTYILSTFPVEERAPLMSTRNKDGKTVWELQDRLPPDKKVALQTCCNLSSTPTVLKKPEELLQKEQRESSSLPSTVRKRSLLFWKHHHPSVDDTEKRRSSCVIS